MMIWVALALAAPEPELVWVETDDGAHVALHHTPRPDGPPVVLCHGISSNARFWDLEPGRSLVDALWAVGFDVWNLDLRGHGDAARGPDGARQAPGWTIDDYGEHDLPAVFDHVRAATGRARLHYVGHSMGGMVLAVYLATRQETPLASAVVVGSPLDFRDPDLLVGLLLGAAPFAEGLGRVPTPAAARVFGLLGRSVPLQLDAVLHNPANLDRRVERRMLRTVVSPLTRGELQQFAQTRADGEFRSADGTVAYREHLGHVTTPMLFVAGRADRVVSPDRVRAFHDAVGSPDKRLWIVSTANGAHGDYGHLDLGLGDHAEEDVFAPILAWLRAHP